MPESRRIGLDNPTLSGRMRTHGRSAHFDRRPVQPQVRRGIDGFVIATKPKPKVSQTAVVQSSMTPKKQAHGLSTRKPNSLRPALPRQSRSIVLQRATSKKRTQKKRIRSKQSAISILLVGMASMVFLGGVAVSYMGWKTNRKAAAQVEVLSSSTEDSGNDVPTEENVDSDAVASYKVAADLPRIIKIPRLNTEARIKRLGVKANGMLAAPANVFDAGWYEGSSKPGENGTVLIDGHVHGPTKPGVFYRLNNLKEGDSVEIERGDGKVFTYKVVSFENVDHDKVDMTKALTSVERGKPGLNIITCTGRYDIRTNTYEQRLIVYLVQQ